jgi:hypothetical protein
MSPSPTSEVLARAINGAMGSPQHDHGGHGPDYPGCTCDGTVGDHYSGHVLTRIKEAGYTLVPARHRIVPLDGFCAACGREIYETGDYRGGRFRHALA